MKNLLRIIVMFFLAGQVFAQLEWKKVGTMPNPVWGGQLAYDFSSQSTKIYILGGYSESLQREVDWIQEYDVVQNSWRIVGNMKQIRKDFVADIWKNNIVYFGGVVESSTDKYTIESWDFKLGTTQPTVFDRNANFGRLLSTGHVKGDKLYIIGGDSLSLGGSALFPYILEFNMITQQTEFIFTITSSKDKPRQHMTFIVGDNIYIFGGLFNGVKKSIQKFNIPEKKFSNVTEQLIEARAGGAAVYNPGSQKGFIIGGYNETEKALNSVEEVVLQSDGTLKISSSTNNPLIPSLNYARTNLMAVNYKGTVAVFGGKDASGKVVPYVEILTGNPMDNVPVDILPLEWKLYQNYPNPFNPSTVIGYQLSVAGHVILKVYDVLGNEVTTLVNEYQQAGSYNSTFSIRNSQLTAGVYFYKLTVGNYSSTKKMILLK